MQEKIKKKIAIKYKTLSTYNSLQKKKIIHTHKFIMPKPSTTCGNYVFKLGKKSKPSQFENVIVEVVSEPIPKGPKRVSKDSAKTRFGVYYSRSSLSWRLALVFQKGILEKGNNYTLNTLIHPALQTFLHEHVQSLERFTKDQFDAFFAQHVYMEGPEFRFDNKTVNYILGSPSGTQSTKRFSRYQALNILDTCFPCGEYLKTKAPICSAASGRRMSNHAKFLMGLLDNDYYKVTPNGVHIAIRDYLQNFFHLTTKQSLQKTNIMGLHLYTEHNRPIRLYITNYWQQCMQPKARSRGRKANPKFLVVSRTFKVTGKTKQGEIYTSPYFVVRGDAIETDRFGLITNLVSCGPMACKPLEYVAQTGTHFLNHSLYPRLLDGNDYKRLGEWLLKEKNIKIASLESLLPSVKLGYGSVEKTMYVLCLRFLDVLL